MEKVNTDDYHLIASGLQPILEALESMVFGYFPINIERLLPSVYEASESRMLIFENIVAALCLRDLFWLKAMRSMTCIYSNKCLGDNVYRKTGDCNSLLIRKTF